MKIRTSGTIAALLLGLQPLAGRQQRNFRGSANTSAA
jgi:hypothetical protein